MVSSPRSLLDSFMFIMLDSCCHGNSQLSYQTTNKTDRNSDSVDTWLQLLPWHCTSSPSLPSPPQKKKKEIPLFLLPLSAHVSLLPACLFIHPYQTCLFNLWIPAVWSCLSVYACMYVLAGELVKRDCIGWQLFLLLSAKVNKQIKLYCSRPVQVLGLV